MKKFIILSALAAALVSALSSCDSSGVYDKYYEIPKLSWHKDSLLTFHVPAEDASQSYNLIIQIRNEISYKYSNLWLFCEFTDTHGAVKRDTFEITLAEPSGRWMGKGNGSIKTLQTVYKRDFRFPAPGEYTFSIQHGMRDERLTGIHNVGFRVEKVSGRG